MKKVAFVIYRAWAYEIFKAIVSYQRKEGTFLLPIIITTPQAEFDVKEAEGVAKVVVVAGNDQEAIASLLKDNQIDTAFYYGWSWMVREPVLSGYTCLCLHPSLLPKYRGGSPIQHQIIAGEKQSAVTVFRMGEGVDDGDIYGHIPISLEGSLADIFFNIISAGVSLTRQYLNDLITETVSFIPQKDPDLYPPLKRRTKDQSEIVLGEVLDMRYEELYNKVRALDDPYPNAYIRTGTQTIYLQKVSKCENVPDTTLNNSHMRNFSSTDKLFLKLSDGYANISKFRVE